MSTYIKDRWTRVNDACLAFSLWLAELMSWPLWVPAILLLSGIALALRWVDATVYILTVQTAVDAAATKMLQSHLREKDEARDALLAENVDSLRALVLEVRGMVDAQTDMMEAAGRRDRLSAKRDAMILTALESRGDLYDFVTRGGVLGDEKGAASRRPGATRKAHGRANRKRP